MKYDYIENDKKMWKICDLFCQSIRMESNMEKCNLNNSRAMRKNAHINQFGGASCIKMLTYFPLKSDWIVEKLITVKY